MHSDSGAHRLQKLVASVRLAALVAIVASLGVLHAPPARADNGITAINQSTYVDGSNELHLVGEIRNDTSQAVAYVNIHASLLDASGKTFDGTQGYAEINILQPGDVVPYDVTKFPAPDNFATYKLHMTWEKADRQPAGGLTVVNDDPFDDGAGYVHLSGHVDNNGPTQAVSVTVIATYYHDDGSVAFVWSDHTDPSTIPPGGSGQFELVSRIHPYASYRVQAAARAGS